MDGERDQRWRLSRGATVRLTALAALLAAAGVCFGALGVVGASDIGGWADAAGPLAPVAFVPISALLGALLVPGPVLAGASGALFGAAVGTVVTIAASVVSALISLYAGRAGGRQGFAELRGPGLARLEAAARRNALPAVIVQRLLPAVPDAPLSYAFGALGLNAWPVALGTAIGVLPRAFSYTAIGASLDDPDSPLAVVGVGTLVLTVAAGALLARRLVRGRRPIR